MQFITVTNERVEDLITYLFINILNLKSLDFLVDGGRERWLVNILARKNYRCTDSKLMQSNQSEAKFPLKSVLNCLLIDFFDPILAVQFTHHEDSFRIRKKIRSKKSIHIENLSKFIKIYRI